MKRENLFIVITLSLFLTTSCGTQNKKEIEMRSLSLEECYEKNLTDSTLMTGWYYISDMDSEFVRQMDRTDDFFTINPFPIVTAEDMIVLSVEKNNWDETYLLIKFGKAGTALWREATEKAIGGNLALIVNDRLLCTPQVHSKITAGVSALGRIDLSRPEKG